MLGRTVGPREQLARGRGVKWLLHFLPVEHLDAVVRHGALLSRMAFNQANGTPMTIEDPEIVGVFDKVYVLPVMKGWGGRQIFPNRQTPYFEEDVVVISLPVRTLDARSDFHATPSWGFGLRGDDSFGPDNLAPFLDRLEQKYALESQTAPPEKVGPGHWGTVAAEVVFNDTLAIPHDAKIWVRPHLRAQAARVIENATGPGSRNQWLERLEVRSKLPAA